MHPGGGIIRPTVMVDGFDGYQQLLAKFGKHSTGKSCLYIKKLEDVDVEVLREIVEQSVEHVAEMDQG